MDEKLPSYQLMGTPSSSTKHPLRTCATFSLAASIFVLACVTVYSTHYALLQSHPAGTPITASNPMVKVDRGTVREMIQRRIEVVRGNFDYTCWICETSVSALQFALSDKTTVQDIEADLEYMCSYLWGSLKKQCEDSIKADENAALDILNGKTTEAVCRDDLKLCPKNNNVYQVFFGAPKAGSNSDADTSNPTIVSSTIKPSQSSVVPQLGSRAEALDVSSSWTWKELAEAVLCNGGSAGKIQEALHDRLPDHHIFVLVTKPYTGVLKINQDEEFDYIQDGSKCGHELLVWTKVMQPHESFCSKADVRWAHYIINEAVRRFSRPIDMLNDIIRGLSTMKLDYHIIGTWDPSSLEEWSYWAFDDCIASNNNALVYIKPKL